MNCPVCGERTTVLDCAAECDCVYRRRKCVVCGHRFTTTEQESNDTKILNYLKNGRKEKRRK